MVNFIIYLKKVWQEVEEENKDEMNRIHEYWDKKTLFVHRRALMIGFALGMLLGADVFCGTVYYMLTFK